MILISAGTVPYNFKRLVDTCYTYFSSYSSSREKVIIQTGSYHFPSTHPHIFNTSQLSLEEMINLYRKARIIVSASGEGSVSLILHYAKCQPILFPRQQKFHEHVDDQQVLIAQTIARQKVAVSVYNEEALKAELDRQTNGLVRKNITRKIGQNTRLVEYLDKITSDYD